jgi:hypothetical protein
MPLNYVTDFGGLLTLAIGVNASYSTSVKIDEFLFGDFRQKALNVINSIKEKNKKTIIGEELSRGLSSSIKKVNKCPFGEVQNYFDSDTVDFIKNFNSEKFNAECSEIKVALSNFRQFQRENLRCATLLSTFYAFFITLLAPYDFSLFKETLVILNFYLLLMSIIFVVSDWRNKKLNIILISFFYLPIILLLLMRFSFIGEIYNNIEFAINSFMVANYIILSHSILDYNCIFTILVCFVSLFVYILLGVFDFVKMKKYEKLLIRVEEIEKIKNDMKKFLSKNLGRLRKTQAISST